MRRIPLAAVLALLVLAPVAHAFDEGAEADNSAKYKERFAGDQGSSGYQSELALQSLSGASDLAELLVKDPQRAPVNQCGVVAGPCAGDVRLYDWGGRYGLVREARYVNRNGALISSHLWAPLPKRGRPRRMPAILIVNGDLAPEQVYWWAAQALARHGYVVMTYDPQGHGHSDTYGSGADRLRHVAIQQVAASDSDEAPANEDAAEQAEDALDFLLSSRGKQYRPVRPAGRARQLDRAHAGAADAFDPMRPLVNGRRIGLAGHSRGALAVSIVSTQDPRVGAIAAWDNLLADPPLRPRVPALGMSADYYETPQPYTEDPDPQGKNAAFAAYRRAGVDVMELTVRGGTHYEWSYVPNPAFGATLRGIDMAGWYTQAWFDKYLKRNRRADRRLLSDRWRADPAEAAVDPRGDGNMFSFYYRSRVAIHVRRRAHRRHGHRHRRRVHRLRRVLASCDDLRAGCRWLVPKRRDGYRGEYSYLRARSSRR